MPHPQRGYPDQSLALAKLPFKPGFSDGLRAFGRGFVFVMGTPRVWLLALIPIIVTIGLGGLLSFLSLGALHAWTSGQVATAGTGLTILWRLAQVLSSVVAIVLSFFIAQLLAQPISGPALDHIVRHRYRALGLGELPDPPVLDSVLRALKVSLITLVVSAPPIFLLTILEMLFPVLIVITWPAKFFLAALVATWNFVDYPFALVGAGVRRRHSWLFEHLGASFSFGGCLTLIGMVPLMGLLMLPIAVAGATDLCARRLLTPASPPR